MSTAVTHYDLNDEEFILAFDKCTLPPALFKHEAHVRLAWLNIRELGVEKAIGRTGEQIIKYATSLGEAEIYHDTLTRASVQVVYHFILKDDCDTFSEFMENNPRLNEEFKELLETHYSSSLLWSNEARASYIAPDLLPFDAATSVAN